MKILVKMYKETISYVIRILEDSVEYFFSQKVTKFYIFIKLF